MDEALCAPVHDRFWESAWAVSGPDKEIRGELVLLFSLLRWQENFFKKSGGFPEADSDLLCPYSVNSKISMDRIKCEHVDANFDSKDAIPLISFW